MLRTPQYPLFFSFSFLFLHVTRDSLRVTRDSLRVTRDSDHVYMDSFPRPSLVLNLDLVYSPA